MMGKFLVVKTKKGFHFNLKAGNGQVIGTSQVYASEKACINGVLSVQTCASFGKIEDLTFESKKPISNPKFEIYKDKKGEFRFRLIAKNGENILASEGYKLKASAKNGIESVMVNAKSPIEK